MRAPQPPGRLLSNFPRSGFPSVGSVAPSGRCRFLPRGSTWTQPGLTPGARRRAGLGKAGRLCVSAAATEGRKINDFFVVPAGRNGGKNWPAAFRILLFSEKCGCQLVCVAQHLSLSLLMLLFFFSWESLTSVVIISLQSGCDSVAGAEGNLPV